MNEMSMLNHTQYALGHTFKQRMGDYVITYEVVGWNEKAQCNVWEEKRKTYSPCTLDTASLYRYEDSKENYDRLLRIRAKGLGNEK